MNDKIPFSKKQLDEIREYHADLIWTAHQERIEDVEAFDIYLNKMASAHTMVTMLLIEKDRDIYHAEHKAYEGTDGVVQASLTASLNEQELEQGGDH